MNCKLTRVVGLLVGFGSIFAAGTLQAQDPNTYLYIAHAGPGRQISATSNPMLPVDISINGECVVKNVSYGDMVGPYSEPGNMTYSFTVRLANAPNPCTGATVFSASVPLAAGTSYVAALTVDSNLNIGGALYQLDLSGVAAGQGRVAIINATGMVFRAEYTANGTKAKSMVTVPAGQVRTLTMAQGEYMGLFVVPGSTVSAVGPYTTDVMPQVLQVYVLSAYQRSNLQVTGPKIIHGVF